MQVINKLGQLLNIDEGQHGIIAEIAEETGLSRHQVRELLHNEAKSVSYSTLAKVCKYLIDHDLVDPALLPGALLGFAPNEFWPLLSERWRIEFCLGKRRDPHWYDELVMAADSELQAKLIHQVTQYRSRLNRSNHSAIARDGQIFHQQLIAAPTREGDNQEETVTESEFIYDEFGSQANDKALICLGSVKSNSVIERFVSQCFAKTTAFRSQDDVSQPRDRSVPFTIIFRKDDPRLDSCCGGQRLSRETADDGPGIYFEEADETWTCVPWDDRHDGAVVMYRYHKSLRNLCMCLGGYSSRGTRFLAEFLGTGDADKELWPPTYDDGEVQVGLFVLRFTLENGTNGRRRRSKRVRDSFSTEVFSVSEAAIRRRIRPARHQRGAAKKAVSTTRPR